ncbi:aldo/keto reductase [Paramicrobacterium fandaimingii]|uniref:aldo/keto reductase n=1 Tax=Paramicrobacterium fandaimingii TaxID=2708079 RepID=UPI001423150A|nr:aldo/keto reductase [Microbacterium fandaimingii]
MTSTTTYPADSTHLLGGQYRVPRIGYGTMRLSGPGVIGLPEDVNGAIAILRHAVELGVRFFDTANAYGPRTVNQLIGRALAPFNEEIVVGNKVGASRGPRGEWLTDSRPETIRTQVEDALLDLRTDISPLTYLRLWGDSTDRAGAIAEGVPLEDSLGTLVELREAGKVRHIGISGASPTMLERARRITPIAAVQNRFNLLDRSGVGVLSACERDEIAFVPYFPLATGTLANLDALIAPARRLDAPTTTIALAWLLRRSPAVIPIPGTASPSHLQENVRAATLAPQLTDDEVKALTAVEDEANARLDTMSTQATEAIDKQRAITESTRPTAPTQ